VSALAAVAWPPAAATSATWPGSACALGGQAARSWARSGRRPGLCTVTATVTTPVVRWGVSAAIVSEG